MRFDLADDEVGAAATFAADPGSRVARQSA
jgi:hypothetical protein